MVRLMCQNGLRACCDEGEKVDEIRAMKAVTALAKPEEEKMSYRTILNVSENSSDSFTSQEMTSVSEGGADSDTDGEHLYIVENFNENGNNMNNNNDKQAVEKRRQRRRERNRKSAQAYRQRRRQQTQKSDEMLHELLEKNHLLREKMSKLEEEKTFILDILKTKIKIPWPYPVFMPYPCPTGAWSTQDVTMSTPIGMDSVVPEVIVAS